MMSTCFCLHLIFASYVISAYTGIAISADRKVQLWLLNCTELRMMMMSGLYLLILHHRATKQVD